jgi:hypothetical protein
MTIIRQRAYPYYRKHPAAAAITLGDGDALDSGTAADIDSNIGHLQYQGVRQLCSSLGGQRQSFVTAVLALAGYDDVPAPMFDGTYSGVAPNQLILWGPNTSYMFGPVDLIADRVVGSGLAGEGRAVLRPVNCEIDVYSPSTDFTSTQLIYALTQSPDPAALFRGEYLALASVSTSFGRAGFSITKKRLTLNTPVTPSMEARWTCRDVGTVGGVAVSRVESTVIPGYIWFGHLFLNTTNQPGFVNSMCAREVREGFAGPAIVTE